MPDSLISDDEAYDLADQFKTAEGPRRNYLGGLLLDYQDQQKQVQSQQADTHFEKLFTDPDYFKSTAEQAPVTAAASINPFPDSVKYRGANQAFLANSLGVDPDTLNGVTYEAQRDGYARTHFDKQGDVTDEGFFNGVKAQQQKKIDTRNAVANVPADIIISGVDSLTSGKPMKSPVEIVNDLKTAHPEIVPAKGEESIMLKAATAYAQDTSDFMVKYGDTVKSLFDILKAQASNYDPQSEEGKQRLADFASGKAEKVSQDLVDRLAQIPPDDRQKIKEYAAVYAQKIAGKDGDWRTIMGNFQNSVFRTIEAPFINGFGAKEAQLQDEIDQLNGKSLAKNTPGVGPQVQASDFEEENPLTDDQKSKKIASIQSQINAIQVDREISDFSNSTIDPIKAVSTGWMRPIEEGAYMVAGSAPLVGAAFIPGAGPFIVGGAIASTEYNRIRLQYPDVPVGQAQGMAVASSAAQSMLFNLRASSISGALPTTSRFIEGLAKPNPGATFWNSVFSKAAAVNIGEQTAQQIGISLTPVIVDGLYASLTDDMPQYDWGKHLEALKGATPSTVASMIPFIILGVAGVGINETRRGRELLNDPISLNLATGIDLEAAQKIAAEEDPAKQVSMYQTAFKGVTPEALKATVDQADAEAKSQEAAAADPESPKSFTSQDADGNTVFNIQDKAGNIIHSTTDADAHVTAMQSVTDHGHDANQQAVSALISHFESDNESKGRAAGEQTFEQSGKKVTALDQVNETPEGLGQLNERIRIAALSDPGVNTLPLHEIQIFGHNEGEVREGVYHDVSTLHEGADASTVIEERVHGETDRAIHEGRVTVDSLREGVRSVEQATGERMMSDEATPQEIKEAVGKIGVAYMFGRVRDSRLPAGFRGFFRQLGTYFKEVFGRAGRLRKAIAEGKVKGDFHDFIADSVGLPLSADIERAKMAELQKEVPGASASNEKSFSLGRFERALELEKALNERDADPKLRKANIAKAKKTLWEIAANQKPDKEAKAFDATATLEQLEADRASEHADLHGAEEDALVKSAMENRDNFEQRIYEAKTDATRAALKREMTARESEKRTAVKQAYKAKRDAVDAKFKAESAKINRESTVAGKESEQKAKVANQRAELVLSMGKLEAILRILPAEVRAKVGGYVKLSKLTNHEARQKFLMDRIEKVSEALETFQKKDFDKQFDKLLKKSLPVKGTAGAKKVGKIGADVHQLFDVLREAKYWTAEEAEAHAQGLESQIATGHLTPEQEAHAELEANLVRLVGDWAHADAARREAALENAAEVLRKGYSEARMKKLEISERRATERADLESDTGKDGLKPERDQTDKVERNTWFGLRAGIKKMALNLSSFEQVMHYAFGKDSVVGNKFVDSQVKGEYQKEDGIQTRMAALDSLFRALGGGGLKGEKLRYDLGSKKSVTFEGTQWNGVELTQLEGVAATLMWKRAQGRMHMIGKLDDTGKPVSKWHYNQEFVDKVESQLSPEAKSVRDFLAEQYAKEHGEINPLYKDLYGISLPKDKNYSPITVDPYQKKAGQVVDPTTGQATSAGSTTPSALKSLSSFVAEPQFRDAIQTYIAHVKQIEHWKAFAKFSGEALSILNNRELRNAVQARGGKEASTVLGLWVDYFAQGGFRDASAQLHFNGLMSHLVHGASSVLLVGKASVLAVQSVQLGAALAEMGYGQYLSRFGKLFTGQLGWSDAFHSDYIQRRLEQMPVLIQQAMQGLASGNPNALKHNVAKLGQLISGADALFTAGTYAMVLDHQRGVAKDLGLTGVEAETYAHENAARITDRVAQPTRGGARSIYENTAVAPSHRLLWAFASESRQKLALAAWGLAAKDKPIGERTRALAVAWAVGGIGATVVRAAVADAIDPSDDDIFDDKHWNPKRLALSSLTGPLQGIPVLGDALNATIFGLAGVYQPEGTILDAKNAVAAVRRIPKTVTGQSDTEHVLKDADSILSALGMANETLAAAASVTHLAKQLYGTGKNVEKTVDPEPTP